MEICWTVRSNFCLVVYMFWRWRRLGMGEIFDFCDYRLWLYPVKPRQAWGLVFVDFSRAAGTCMSAKWLTAPKNVADKPLGEARPACLETSSSNVVGNSNISVRKTKTIRYPIWRYSYAPVFLVTATDVVRRNHLGWVAESQTCW